MRRFLLRPKNTMNTLKGRQLFTNERPQVLINAPERVVAADKIAPQCREV